MIKFAIYLKDHFDAIVFTYCMIISGIAFFFNAKFKRQRKKASYEDETKKYILAEMDDPKSREQYLKGLSSIWLYVPFIAVNLIFLLDEHSPHFLLIGIISLIFLEIIYFLRHPALTFALLDYTDASRMFCNVVFQNPLLLLLLCAVEYLRLFQIDLFPVSIPVFCWIGGLHGLFSLIQMTTGGKKDILHPLPAVPLLWLAFTQSLTIISSWAVGGYQFAAVLGYRNLSWGKWFRFLCLYHGDLAISILRWTGIGLVFITAAIQCYFTIRLLAKKKNHDLLQGGVPAVLLLIGAVCCMVYVTEAPNYLIKLKLPSTKTWETETPYDYAVSTIDNLLPVFPNGTPISMGCSGGVIIDYSIKIIDDFSHHPYLCIYSRTVYDGCVEIWAENQSGIDISNCKFSLTDSDGQLSKCFSKEALSTSVYQLVPGESRRLFTLKNEDMVKSICSEIPLTMWVTAVFDADSQHWKTTRTVAGEVLLSMRGVTIRNPYQANADDGQLIVSGKPLNISTEIHGDTQWVPSFYCEQTALLQIDASVITSSQRMLPLGPIFFVYEVRN